jgi:5'-methylthioadenosine phosphorylase
MIRIGVIGGTGARLALDSTRPISGETPYGRFEALVGSLPGRPDLEIVFVSRHGAGHALLSSSVRHRANLWGLKESGVAGVVGTTVCGILDPATPLGRPIVFDDLYFPDNRLPEGGPCTFFDEPGRPGRGHLILSSPFSPSLRAAALRAATGCGREAFDGGTYAYALGPRFNSRAEIAQLRAAGAVAVSQTAGPEAVLAGELELPYCLVGYGTDYANGVRPDPTSIEELEANLGRSGPVLEAIVTGTALGWSPEAGFDTGLVYRFD